MNLIPFVKAVLFLIRVHNRGRAAAGVPDPEGERIEMDLTAQLNQAEQDRLNRLAGQ